MPEVGVAMMPVLPDFSKFSAGVAAQQSGIASSFAKVGKVAAVAFVGAAAGAVVGLGKLGSAFDDAYDTIRTGTGATGKALKGLESDFKGVVQNVPASFKDASTAVADLNTRLGLTGAPLQERSKQFLELSRITGTDVAGNVAAVTRVFGDWGISADQQAGAMDKLFRASQATGIGVQDLSTKVVQFGAPMRQFGFSFEESTAIMAKWEKEGVNTETIMGGLRVGLGKLAAAGKDPAQAFAEITEKVKASSSASEAAGIVSEVFGKRAGPDLAAAIKEGRFEISDLLGVISGGKETIIGAGKDTADFGEKWTMIKNQVFVALEPVAMALFDAIGRGMDNVAKFWHTTLQPAFVEIRKWWDDNSPPIIALAQNVAKLISEGFDKLVGGAQTVIRNWNDIRPVVEAIGILVVTVMIPHWIALRVAAVIESARVVAAWVVTHVEAIKAAVIHSAQVVAMVAKWVFLGVTAMAQAAIIAGAWLISMGPIPLIVLAIAGLAIAFVKNWDSIKGAVLTGVQFVVDKFLLLVTTLVDGAAKAFGWVPGLGPKLEAAAAEVNKFRDNVNASLEGIKDKKVTVWVELGGQAYSDYRKMERDFANDGFGIPGTGGRISGSGYRGIIDHFQASGLPGRITSTVRPGARTASGNLSLHAVGRAVDFAGTGPQMRAIFNYFKAAGSQLKELIHTPMGFGIKNGQRVSSFGPAVDRQHYNHVHVALAEGGIVTQPTIALIGEAGPEAVIPLGKMGGGSMPDMAYWREAGREHGRASADAYAKQWRLIMRTA